MKYACFLAAKKKTDLINISSCLCIKGYSQHQKHWYIKTKTQAN